MKPFTLSLLACIASCVLASLNASATRIATAPIAATSAASHRVSTPKGAQQGGKSSSSRAKSKSHTVKPPTPAPKRVVANKKSNRNSDTAQKSEQADIDARANRMYRSSQFSAPIIIDAKACKRSGANGESIYENC